MANYVINPQHRDGNPHKSQWTVSQAAECSLFNTSNSSGWLDFSSKKGFGINKTEAAIDQLGLWTDRVTVLKIAKFVGDQQDQWHGYPANYRKNQHDKPAISVLNLWFVSDLISKADMSRIKLGKKCNL
jgi:hypothetical protein